MKPFQKALNRLARRRRSMNETWANLKRNPKINPEKAFKMPGSMKK